MNVRRFKMRISNTLFNEIVDDIEQYIPKLITASHSIGDLFYEPLTNEGSQFFSDYITGLSNLIQTVMMTLKDAADHAPSMIEPVTYALQAIPEQVAELEKALAQQQFVHVADILKYELADHLDKLLQALKESRS